MTSTVKIIGICGYPEHGKSTAQRFLEKLGVRAIDDKEQLRKMAMFVYDLTWEDVSTQIGKSRVIYRPEHRDTVTIRQAIGDLGKVYETKHGPNFWIERAIEAIEGDSPVSFGSVRMGQAHAIRAAGGFVIAIRDPRRPISNHDFDQFDHEGVDRFVMNNWGLWTLERRVVRAASDYLGVDFNAYWAARQQEETIASMVSV